jgi:hypothetical protein
VTEARTRYPPEFFLLPVCDRLAADAASSLELLATPAGFEPATPRLGNGLQHNEISIHSDSARHQAGTEDQWLDLRVRMQIENPISRRSSYRQDHSNNSPRNNTDNSGKSSKD